MSLIVDIRTEEGSQLYEVIGVVRVLFTNHHSLVFFVYSFIISSRFIYPILYYNSSELNLILLFYFILNLWQPQIRTASLLSRKTDIARNERQTDLLCFILHQGLAELALLTLQPVQRPPLTRTASQLLSTMSIPNLIQLSS